MSSGMLQNKDTEGAILPAKLEVQLTLDNSNSEGRQGNHQSKKQKRFMLAKVGVIEYENLYLGFTRKQKLVHILFE